MRITVDVPQSTRSCSLGVFVIVSTSARCSCGCWVVHLSFTGAVKRSTDARNLWEALFDRILGPAGTQRHRAHTMFCAATAAILASRRDRIHEGVFTACTCACTTYQLVAPGASVVIVPAVCAQPFSNFRECAMCSAGCIYAAWRFLLV